MSAREDAEREQWKIPRKLEPTRVAELEAEMARYRAARDAKVVEPEEEPSLFED